jgi:hypothetical protein
MAGNTSTIELKVNGIAQIKKELRELKGELASATDPKQMAELAAKAGELSDQLKDANERVAVFASGSPFEQTNNALGLMGSQLMSLDFEGAAESSKLFASAAKGINGDMIAKSLKSLSTVVFQVGKAFMSVGLSLLTNPIFLIAAAIIAIVAVIALLMNKLGILKPILDAIGKVFGFIMAIINAVIEAFKMLTDWLGLTAHAAEESAARQIAASEKKLAALEKTSESQIDMMDHEMRLAKIQGEDVAIAEAQKQKYIIETTKIRVEELEKQVKLHRRLGDLEAEDLQKLKDSLEEQKKALREAGQDFEALRLENKKKIDDNAKKVEENRKKVWENSKKVRQEEAKDRLNALRSLQDMELELMDEGIEKELKANKYKYQRLKEDTQANDKLTLDEKKKMLDNLALLESTSRDAINEAAVQAEKDKQAKINQAVKDSQELAAQAEEEYFEQYRQLTTSKEQLEIDAVNEKYFQLIEDAKKYNLDVSALETQQKDELAKINDDYRQKELVKENALKQAKLDLVSGGLDATQQIISAFAGKSEAQQKRAFQIQKAVSIAQAVMDTYKGANAIFASAAANPASILFPAQPFIQAGLAIAAGIANVKKIASTQFGGGATPSGGGSTGGASGGGSSTQPATPNVSMFGQNNNANNLSSTPSQEANGGGEMVVKAVVVESDITNAQNQANKFKTMAEL